MKTKCVVTVNRCDSCLREMVFVFDAIHMKEDKEAVLLREYPSNHEQRRAALVQQVKNCYSFRSDWIQSHQSADVSERPLSRAPGPKTVVFAHEIDILIRKTLAGPNKVSDKAD